MSKGNIRDKISRRAEQKIESGYWINLGIGIPTLVANYIQKEKHVNLD